MTELVAPTPNHSKTLGRLLFLAITAACFAYLFYRLNGAAARQGLPLVGYMTQVFANVRWLPWLLLMMVYSGFYLMIDTLVVTRALTYVPVYVLGFSQTAIVIYVVVVVVQATFIHANVRWQFRPLRWLLATPAFHHWHHAAEAAAVNKNFSVHTPIWDKLFGSYYLPDHWPGEYGLCWHSDVPVGWLRQFVYPFRRGKGR